MFWTFTVDSKPNPLFISTQGVMMRNRIGELKVCIVLVLTVMDFCGHSHSLSVKRSAKSMRLACAYPGGLGDCGLLGIPWLLGALALRSQFRV